MPLRADVTFRLPQSTRHIGFRDLHRLGCYLAEPASHAAHTRQDKDFAVWPLLEDDGRVVFRLHALSDEDAIAERVRSRVVVTPHLGPDLPLLDPSLDVQRVTFEQLASRDPVTSVRVEFVSPTMFSRNGRNYALPDPVVVHQHLVRRWNLFAPEPLRITEDDARSLLRAMTLEATDIRADRIPDIIGRSGFIGSATFHLIGRSSANRRHLRSLWSFAEYSGVGALTTQGLGALAVSEWGV